MKAASFIKKSKLKESQFVVNGRKFDTITFTDDGSANEYMEQNPDWGVIGEDNDGTIHLARMDDMGSINMDETVVIDKYLTKIVESGTYTKNDINTLAKYGFKEEDFNMFKESTNNKFVTKSIHKVLNRIVESGTYTKDDLKILAKEGIDRKDLKMFTESTVNTRPVISEKSYDVFVSKGGKTPVQNISDKDKTPVENISDKDKIPVENISDKDKIPVENISDKDKTPVNAKSKKPVEVKKTTTESANKKFVTKSIHKVLNRIVESGTYTKDDLKILAKEGIDRKDLKMFTESTVNTRPVISESQVPAELKALTETVNKLLKR